MMMVSNANEMVDAVVLRNIMKYDRKGEENNVLNTASLSCDYFILE